MATKDWVVVSPPPEYEVFHVHGLASWAREHRLDYAGLSGMALGNLRQGSVKGGWQCYYEKDFTEPQEINLRTFKKPQGEITPEVRQTIREDFAGLVEDFGIGGAWIELEEQVDLSRSIIRVLAAIEGVYKTKKLNPKVINRVKESVKHHYLEGVPGHIETYKGLKAEMDNSYPRVIAHCIDWENER